MNIVAHIWFEQAVVFYSSAVLSIVCSGIMADMRQYLVTTAHHPRDRTIASAIEGDEISKILEQWFIERQSRDVRELLKMMARNVHVPKWRLIDMVTYQTTTHPYTYIHI